MKNISSLFILLFLLACGEGKTPKFHKASEVEFSKFVNQKSLPKNPNLSLDKVIVNNDYPIEIALYKDNKFYYDLPNLGNGTGTWQYFAGYIVLNAKRTLFDMKIEVHGEDVKMNHLKLKFFDRHGLKILGTENVNFQ